jgi:hypothetical protein
MNFLESSAVLIERIKYLKMDSGINDLVQQYISENRDMEGMRFSTLFFRSNLNFIIENIENPELTDMLIGVISKKVSCDGKEN